MDKHEIQNIEIKLLLDAIFLKYGYDFRDYGKAHVKRRILHRLNMDGLATVTEMQDRVLGGDDYINTLLADLTINVTEMFRDPFFYKTLREELIPVLKTYPFIKIWHAGCATGEEVYSMAILLQEEGLYERCQIYATDVNSHVLQHAKKGIYDMSLIKDYTANYTQSGGRTSLSDYYTARYNSVILDDSLKRRIVFAEHNLATDYMFGEMHLVICRNVLIYFNQQLQEIVLDLFTDSLCNGGFLCLGSKESLKEEKHLKMYQLFAEKEKIFQKEYN